ncbi:MAG: MBL fold metallo-hydrolase, partial [Pseudomonadota bacterium]
RIDAIVREQVAGADLMIFDATYDDENYEAHVGWGHSTWQKGVALAKAAGVGRVLMHHHQPEHDDATLDARDARIRAASDRAGLARQGQVLMLKDGVLSEA